MTVTEQTTRTLEAPGASSVRVVASVTVIFVLLCLGFLPGRPGQAMNLIGPAGARSGAGDAGVELPRLDEPHRDRRRLVRAAA